MTLHIAPGLDLPDDFVTQSAAIVARRGAGKTYLAAVLAEEMIKADLPVVIIDPLGAFWGLRSSADGKRDGLSIVIIGGDHGDIALEPTAGKLVADVIAEDPRPVILDLSAFESNAAQDRFAADFAERLYRAKSSSRTAMHLIVDEADSFAPQRPQPGQQRMLGAFEAIVRRGRIRGLGVTLITQRAAVLNKNVLTQAECLVTLQTTGPQDRKAIDEWIRGHGTDEERAMLLDSLAGLQQGEAWFWSPAWLNVLQRIQVRKRETFDSSATPKAGALRVEPEHRAPLDLKLLQKRMAETIERTKADDPKELRRRIRELERELRDAQSATPDPVVESVEVPVLFDAEADRLGHLAQALADQAGRVEAAAQTISERIGELQSRQDERHRQDVPRAGAAGGRPRAVEAPRPAQRPNPPARREPRGEAVPRTASAEGTLGGGAPRRILVALAQYGELTQGRAAALVGITQKKSTLRNALSALRKAGFVDGSDPLRITQAGYNELGDDFEPLPTGDALLAHWRNELGDGAPRQIFDVLVEAWPDTVDTDTVCTLTDIDATKSTYRNAMSRLRTLGLVVSTRLNPDIAEAIAG